MQLDTSHSNAEALFWKFFANEANEAEKAFLLSWLKESDENKKAFKEARTAYILSKHAKHIDTIDENKEYNKFEAAISSRVTVMWKKFAVAASVIIAVGISIFIFQKMNKSEVVIAQQAESISYISEKGQTKDFILPDSSTVVLRQKSKLLFFPESKSERLVKLEGEAFFDVRRNPEKPFKIQTKSISIEVLGTSFIVNAHLDQNYEEVRVLSGTVKVTSALDTVIVKANQIAVFDKLKNELSFQNYYDKNDIAWQTNELAFEATELSKVAIKLSDYFDKKIIIADSAISHYPLSANFSSPDLNSVLTLLQLTFDIEIEHTDSVILLKNKIISQ
ncbi:MAG: FecR domain-containing protein [Bacteroidales bacterium]|nr:FecR domain-containing protein [Bacteroidales bacterium]